MNRGIIRPALLALALAALAAPAAAQDAQHAAHGPAGGAGVPLLEGLGSHHHPISSRSPLAQQYFDQGIRLAYAFNHQEAIRAFEEAARQDSSCAICWWGVAFGHGSNINLPMDSASAVAAYAAIRKAQQLAGGASEAERAYIGALATRYGGTLDGQPARDSAYARAMKQLAARYPDDTDALTLHADAVMNLSPWYYWDDTTPRPQTREMLASLDRALARDSMHPGACHLYIHAVEAAFPERAVPCADRLAALMPAAGHLVHMPGHIYIRVGRYEDAIEANEHAVHADESYIRDRRPNPGVYTLGYYPHNYDFLAFAASMLGRGRQAVTASDRQAAVIPLEMAGAPGMAFMQGHLTRNLQMRVRFGRWDEILAKPAPPAELLHATAIWHYARGRAYAARGDVARAEAELARVKAATSDPRLEGVRLEFNESQTVLRIAERVLAGNIALARGQKAEAVAALRQAAEIEDGLTYGEPPDWSVPVRHELGAALLASGDAPAAERAYREDLKRFPANGWALLGLEQSLRAQNRTREADQVRAEFRRAWTSADVEPKASSL
jgi:tetratricopeptide (TPR) repeat protein